MKNLPIGIQSFNNLRTENGGYLYIDKTQHIYNMINSGRIFFLSRPRRFGKSLLVSAMNELFNGNKPIFEGLYIYDKWDWSKKNPIIRLDFSTKANDTKQQLENSLTDFLNYTASNNGLKLENIELPDKFAELITKLHTSIGEKVVVLIDEYDKPILDVIENPKIAKDNKDLLHDFYQVLKGTDEHLRFIFLTGVSKFAGLSIFSALNNINDITIDDKYSAICGYTQEELETNFSEHIEYSAKKLQMSKSELLENIRKQYDGYTWDGRTSVYNPFSTLMFFDKSEFKNYWFRTGTPTFLIEVLKKKNQIKRILEPITVSSNFFDSSNANISDEFSLLFQTGYLTIKCKELLGGFPKYTLSMPNGEVSSAFTESLFNAYSYQSTVQAEALIFEIQKQLTEYDEEGFNSSLKILYANIPYDLHIEQESYYHSLFLLMMKMLGFSVSGELHTNIGRIDAVLTMPQLTVIAEFKYSADKSIEALIKEAMEQIEDRKYYEAYMDKPILLLGVAVSGREVQCRMRQL